jgi:hypothetical protein
MHMVPETGDSYRTTKVSRILDGLDDWRVVHDVWTGTGYIDHVLVGPGGILTIKASRQRGFVRPLEADRALLSQAFANSKWLTQVADGAVDPLLVFSHAWVMPRAAREWGVWVLSHRVLRRHLRQRPQKLSPQDVHATFERLMQDISAAVQTDASSLASASAMSTARAMVA